MSARTGRAVWLALAMLLASLCAATYAHAGPLDPPGQPAFTPRRVLVHRPIRVYADPRIPPNEVGMHNVSLVDVQRRLRRVLRADPRTVDAISDLDAWLLQIERDPTLGDLATLARQAARIGISHFRTYQMATAVDEMEAALTTFGRTPLPVSDPGVVAETHFYLALASLELAGLQPSDAARHAARARRSFREVVRLDPTRRITADTFPSAVVDAWHAAYAEHLVDGGASLGLSASEAAWLATRADVDTVLEAFVLVEREQVWLRIRAWSRRRGAYSLDRRLPVRPSEEDVADVLEQALLAHIACEPLLPPPAPLVVDTERGRTIVSVASAAALFLEVPTRTQIAHMGGQLGVSYTVTESFGLGLDTQLLFSQRDGQGDLVRRVDTVRTVASAFAVGRFGRWRIEGGSGLELTRMSSVQATSSFWCRVSGGDPFVFDDLRACRESDVTRTPASTLFGFEVRARAMVRVVGPVWMQTALSGSFYLLPFGSRTFDFPLSLSLGAAYRF
jgi:hypothetical protein